MKKDQIQHCALLSRRVPEFPSSGDLFLEDLEFKPESLLQDFSFEDVSLLNSTLLSAPQTKSLKQQQQQQQQLMSSITTSSSSLSSSSGMTVVFEPFGPFVDFGFDDDDGLEGIIPAQATGAAVPLAALTVIKTEVMQLPVDAATGLRFVDASSPEGHPEELGSDMEEDGEEEDLLSRSDDEDNEDDEELDSSCSSDYDEAPVSGRRRGGTTPAAGATGHESGRRGARAPASSDLAATPRRRSRKSGVEKRRPGRKAQPVDDETRKMKRKMRQEKNRMAARKCREKKQSYFKDLEDEVLGLRKGRNDMATEITLLKQEIHFLRAKLTASGTPAGGRR